ncbi:hypothetical protein BcepF1.067 [Burkholderia phage BcepF1]|uniref:HTH cro/C1-type domain-containing protein n=1 Tax=Burkholderia phage BcepF1 TaxID=2886897 RepID=A1YZX1_9CAUD|nr:hypothetical protein BcepF1.067 [Burkholderia phage BcepF1]ABL96798.1 hypothetical protein BcepF1.067 [Burkholderia phage BcepF1]
MATKKQNTAVKAPKTAAEILKAAIAKADMTQSAAAEAMGMHIQNLHRYLTGERRVSVKIAKRAETYLGSEFVSAAKLIRAQAETDIFNIDDVEID